MSTTIGCIGAGGVTSWQHFPNLESMDTVDVVAICDIDEATADSAAERFGAAAYTDHEILYAEHDLDAVFVAVPPFAHGPPERAATEHGVDLFVEKPIGLDTALVTEISDTIDDAGLVTQVGYMNRYAAVVQRANELIGDRTPALVVGRWAGGVPGTGWWGIKERSGGQIVEQTTHVFDLVRYFAGDVEHVTAYGGQTVVTEAIDFEDATTTSIKHTTGAVSQVASTCAAPEGTVGLWLVGDGFYLDVDLSNHVLTGTVDGEEIMYDEGCIDDAFRTEIEAFLAAVRDGEANRTRSPYADARRTLELTLAVNESLATTAPVSLGGD